VKLFSEYRKDKNLSQAQLSQELINAGIKVSPASVAMYETGQRTPSLNKARAIAQFFGVSTDDIRFGTELTDLQPTGTD